MPYALLLYAALGSPIYETREFARVELLGLLSRNPGVSRQLEIWASTCPCPETTNRVRKIVNSYRGEFARNYVPAKVPVWPFCDAMPLPNPAVPFGLLDNRDKCRLLRYESDMNYAPYWWGYRRATEVYVRGLIVAGASYAEADQLVERMYELEVRAQGDCSREIWEKTKVTRTMWKGGYPRKDDHGLGQAKDTAPPPTER